MKILRCNFDLAAFRGPTEPLKVNHGQRTGGFFAPTVPFFGYILRIFQIFLTHFIGVATLYVATLTHCNFDPIATLTHSNFDP
jgi:hypothetical protein